MGERSEPTESDTRQAAPKGRQRMEAESVGRHVRQPGVWAPYTAQPTSSSLRRAAGHSFRPDPIHTSASTSAGPFKNRAFSVSHSQCGKGRPRITASEGAIAPSGLGFVGMVSVGSPRSPTATCCRPFGAGKASRDWESSFRVAFLVNDFRGFTPGYSY